MALDRNLKNGEVKRLAAAERLARVRRLLETKIWPSIPKKQLGRRLTRQAEEAILGYGSTGV